MKTVRTSRPQSLEVTQCPACSGSHTFNLTVVIDEDIGGMFFMTTRTETVACSLTCPAKTTLIMVDVPVTLVSGQSLVRVR